MFILQSSLVCVSLLAFSLTCLTSDDLPLSSHASSLLPSSTSGHEQWLRLLLSAHALRVDVYWQLKTQLIPADPSLITCWTRLGFLLPENVATEIYVAPAAAVSREPAGCFTLQIKPVVGGSRRERQRRWHVNAAHCLVIYHNLTTLVLMLLPSGDESFLFRSGYLSAQ